MNATIKKLSSSDTRLFEELIKVFEDVFEMKNFKMPHRLHLLHVLSEDGFIVFVALVEDKVVGGLTAYTMQQYYSSEPLAYIYDLAVNREVQRQGMGKLLVSSLNNYCKEKGYEEVFVQADKIDEHAIEFYRSSGGIREEVVHFNYPLTDKAKQNYK